MISKVLVATWREWRGGRRRWSRRPRCRSTRPGTRGAWTRTTPAAASSASYKQFRLGIFFSNTQIVLKMFLTMALTCKECWFPGSWRGWKSPLPSPSHRWLIDRLLPSRPSETQGHVKVILSSPYIQLYPVQRNSKGHSGSIDSQIQVQPSKFQCGQIQGKSVHHQPQGVTSSWNKGSPPFRILS